MIKRILLPLIIMCLLTLGLSVPALAQETGNGTITGQLVNGTAGGSGTVADVDVSLKTILDGGEVASVTTRTDAEGRFTFDGLSTEAKYGYHVLLTYQDAEYQGEHLAFSENETEKFTQQMVYDATTSPEAIRISVAHTVVYVEQDSLYVEEYFIFVNEGDRTYIGTREVAPGTNETLRFSMPDKATDMQIGIGLMECCIYASEDGFVDSMPVMPGSQELGYSYRINGAGKEYVYARKVDYPLSQFNLLVQADGVEVTSDRLIRQNPLDIQGSRYEYLSGGDFAPGDVLVAQFANLPASSNQAMIVWLAVPLLLALGAAGVIYLVRSKGQPQPVRTGGSGEPRRHKLLVELAQLDDDFEDGKVPERAYRRLRAEKKAQITTLLQGPKGNRGKK